MKRVTRKNPLLTKADGPQVFDARDYGVVADGSPHNNVANLLDCFAQAYAAGAREVLLPAGVIDTSDAVIGTVTANSGRTYTNNGGIPLPTGNQAVMIRGHGCGVTVLKLSAGFMRGFDFWPPVITGTQYRGITIRDITFDRDNLVGSTIAPATAVTGAVTLTAATWVTLPGLSANAFKNAQFVFCLATNMGTAQSHVLPARISESNVQVYNTGAGDLTLASGDQVQGSVQGHVICGTWVGRFRTANNIAIEDVLIEHCEAINVAESTAPNLSTSAPNRSAGIAVYVYNNTDYPPGFVPHVTNFRVRDVQVYGAAYGFDVEGNPGVFLDEIWYEDCFHDTMINPVSNWNSLNYLIGVYAWVNRCGILRCRGRRSGDVAYEVDQPWEARIEDCVFEEAYSGCYTSTFVPPARTVAGPPTTTLNNSGSLTSGATSVTVAGLPTSVARSGLALIESELVWYTANTAGTTLTLTRGVNGTTAATHADGIAVTFVEINKTRVWDVRTTVRNKDVLALSNGSGRAYLSYENSHLPLPPLTIRDPSIEFIGGKVGVGRFLYWSGWRTELDLQGVKFAWDSLSHPSGEVVYGASLISWFWSAGPSMYASGIKFRQPRVFGRNNEFRVHGVLADASTALSVVCPDVGFARLDLDIACELALAGAAYATLSGVRLEPPNGTFVVAPASRLGVKLRTPASVSSDQAPSGFRTTSTSTVTIVDALDVDLDLYELSFSGSSDDVNYRGYTVHASQAGKVRFGKIIHSQGAAVKHPTAKKVAVQVSANYTVQPADEILLVDTTSGAVAITLPNTAAGPASQGEPYSRGRVLEIIDVGLNAATNTITITPYSADKIDGGTAGASTTINVSGGSKRLAAYAAMPGWVTLTRYSNAVLKTPTVTGPKVDQINDTNGNGALLISANASAVNYLQIENAPTNNAVQVEATGTDTNIDMMLRPKGSGRIYVYAPASQTPKITAAGADTNVNLNLTSKGTGTVQVNGVDVATKLAATANLDFGSVAAQSQADLTITVTGAAVGDSVAIGIPTGAVTAGIAYTAWVSATNTVTVRAHNYTTAPLDPASGTFKAVIVR